LGGYLVWDCPFRRTFSNQIMQKWGEPMSVVEQVVLNEDANALIWCYQKSGVYSSHSCFNIISYRGETSVHFGHLEHL
jgi:hypothetical protein